MPIHPIDFCMHIAFSLEFSNDIPHALTYWCHPILLVLRLAYCNLSLDSINVFAQQICEISTSHPDMQMNFDKLAGVLFQRIQYTLNFV